MKKLLCFILCLSLQYAPVLAQTNDIQKLKVENSYLTTVVVDKDETIKQEVTVKKSFLVFVKIKAVNSGLVNK